MTTMPEPRPPGHALDHAPGNGHENTGRLEADLQSIVRRSRRVLWLVVFTQGAVLVLAVLAIVVLAVTLIQEKHRISADEAQIEATQAVIRAAECDTHYAIGTSVPSPATTPVGVQILETERKAFVVLRCPGQLGPPSRQLVQFGRKFHIPIRY